MKTKTKQILTFMHVVTWIIFIGFCINTGAVLYSFFVSLFINPVTAKNLYMVLNLSDLYRYDLQHYVAIVSLIIVLSALKAYLFYLVIKIFREINFVQRFNAIVAVLIAGIGSVAVGIGILTLTGNIYCDWLTKKGVALPNLEVYIGGAVEFLLLAGIIFIIIQVFERRIEIQAESELTA